MHHRRDELDGLRAVAVLLVIASHASNMQFVGGWIGVDIFFVLSGFLITGILTTEFEKSGTISFSTFYLKRILRLAPALVVLLAVNLLAGLVLGSRDHWSNHIGATIASLFYVMNWVSAFQLPYEGHVGHVWSLATEEQFYIVWPAILWAALTLGGRRIARSAAILLILVVMTWRIPYLAKPINAQAVSFPGALLRPAERRRAYRRS
jgi:peptidoglycan/LPS O-acetylase OafA/YrhL